MVIVIIKLSVLPEKRLELQQTLLALIKSARKEQGCLSNDVFQGIENDKDLSLIGMWENREKLDDYLRSDGFTVFLGTRSLLSRSPEFRISKISRSVGWGAVEAVRKQMDM